MYYLYRKSSRDVNTRIQYSKNNNDKLPSTTPTVLTRKQKRMENNV